jgi:pilus assembly protein CpaE
MLVQHPHLISEIQAAVVVTELTLAAARDTIRILSWLKSNAPQTQVTVVANRMHASGQLEINRKDFEGSIERKIDVVIPFDQKLAAQAAKLGKPLAEAGKNSKTVAPIVDLARQVLSIGEDLVASKDGGGGKAGKAKGKSLIGGLQALLPKRAQK